MSQDQRLSAADEPMARGVIEFLGGPRGRFARGSRTQWWTPLRALIAVAWVFLAGGFLSKANCATGTPGEDGTIKLDWSANRQYTSFCYNDIVPLYEGRGLDQPGFPYAYSWQEDGLTRYMEYPVLAGMFQGLMGWIARHTYGLVEWAGVPAAGWYFGLTAMVMACIWVGVIYMVYLLVGNRTWDTILVAASPLIIIHAFSNWDIPAIAFAVGALLAISRHRPWLAGILIGLGTAFKLWPVFLLGAFFVLAWRNRRWDAFAKVAVATAAAWFVVNLPVALKYPDAWAEFFRLNQERGAEWTTLYALISRNLGISFSQDFLNTFSLVAFIFLCAGIALAGWRSPLTPRVAELVFLIVAAFLLVNKVWSPQYSLWLLVPAALAVPRWRLVLGWALADALVWPLLMWHMLGIDNKGIPHELLDVAILVRDGFIIAMAVIVLRQMWNKTEDKVRAAHTGRDPVAGVFQ
ncbi:glycosyltransferase 87 family protein [Corynebacterium sp. KPL2805]|uniref:glycosyltransferase family 87 protein n=1 Tax=Corynebacterium sp. KPL2805 TaxID=3158313 RepID=UPI0032F03090